MGVFTFLKLYKWCQIAQSITHEVYYSVRNIHLLAVFCLLMLGGDYMIPFCRDEILSRFAGIPAV